MKKTSLFLSVSLLAAIALYSCHDTSQKEQAQEKNQSAVRPDSKDNTAFIVDTATVRKVFLEFLPKVSGNRDLNHYIILLGDLNGDGFTDAVIDYSLEPTLEDNGGGGNAIGEIPGVIAFINNGKYLEIADHSELFGSMSDLKKIETGIIFFEGLTYAADDPRCCPSVKTMTKLVLRNNKLTEID